MNWMKNTSGSEDAMLTLSVVTLGIVLLKFLVSEMSIGSLVFGQLDAGVIAALLTPTLGAYVARRHSDRMQSKDTNNDK